MLNEQTRETSNFDEKNVKIPIGLVHCLDNFDGAPPLYRQLTVDRNNQLLGETIQDKNNQRVSFNHRQRLNSYFIQSSILKTVKYILLFS